VNVTNIVSTLMLLSIGGVAGCGARSRLDGDGAGGSPETEPTSTPNECVEVCGEALPTGAEVFFGTASPCICHDCGDVCPTAFCGGDDLPAGECLACAQTAIYGNQCQNHAGLFGACFEPASECNSFRECFLACDP
jgi:hypothetical protein